MVVVVCVGESNGPERNCLPLCDKINLAIKLVFDGRKTSFGAESLHTVREPKG